MSAEPELVPYTPIVVGGTEFDPSACVHGPAGTPHECVHDWRCYWGNQNRPTG